MKFSARLILSFNCLFLACAMQATGTVPVSDDAQSGFYDATPKKGWFWYHDAPAQPEPSQPEKEDEGKKPAAAQQTDPDQKNLTIEELYTMSPPEFQALLTKRMDTAVQYPTEDNVTAYLIMQDIARRKSAAFASAVQFVTQKNIQLSVNDAYPTTVPGFEARTKMKQQEVEKTIAAAKEDHAILFFWRPGCSFCETQSGILKYFSEKYGWEVKPINVMEQPNMAARFNITSTPTLFLIKQGNEKYMPISVGVVSLNEMELKCYQAIRYLNGDTRIDTFTNSDFEKGGSLDPQAVLNKRPE